MNWKYNIYTIQGGRYVCYGQYKGNNDKLKHKMTELLENYPPENIVICKPQDIIKLQMECVNG